MAPLPVRIRAFGGSRTGDPLARFNQLAPRYAPRIVGYYGGSYALARAYGASTPRREPGVLPIGFALRPR